MKEKIEDKRAKISVLGLGYVGYPLACLFSQAGFKVIGYDVDKKKIDDIRNGKCLFEDFEPSSSFSATTRPEDIKADIFLITVPTPLRGDLPDLSYIKAASKTIARVLEKENLVILVSTTYPGTTEEVVLPILESTGLKAGKDFYLCYCPERVDPGRKKWKPGTIPQVIGGFDEKSRELACALYSCILDSSDKLVPVSSLKAAEATKIFENVFRNVNIALVNETAKIFERLGIDTWEVIKTASTKPYGFKAHYPGPGVGGHCIPVDPFYLGYRARKEGFDTRFIQLAGEINRNMPYHVVRLASDTLKTKGKTLRGSKIAVLGATYKKNVPDVRESPTAVIVRELLNEGSDVWVYDALVDETFGARKGKDLEETVMEADCIILVVDHDHFNGLEKIITKKNPDTCVVDTRNFFKEKEFGPDITYICLGKG